jgi:TRAP-type C4-dicarboxylate transport system permease small subunit
VYGLKKLGSSTVWKPWFRGILADFAYIFPTLFWVGFAHFPGRLQGTNVTYVPIHRAFYPSVPRSWLIDFWNLSVKWVFVALPLGFLTMLLFYYDHVSPNPKTYLSTPY